MTIYRSRKGKGTNKKWGTILHFFFKDLEINEID